MITAYSQDDQETYRVRKEIIGGGTSMPVGMRKGSRQAFVAMRIGESRGCKEWPLTRGVSNDGGLPDVLRRGDELRKKVNVLWIENRSLLGFERIGKTDWRFSGSGPTGSVAAMSVTRSISTGAYRDLQSLPTAVS